jgi:hypothetical protein
LNGGTGGNGGVFVLSIGPIPLTIQPAGNINFLSWGNPAFLLLSSTNVAGPYTVIPGATSPYTNAAPLKPVKFFRLVY